MKDIPYIPLLTAAKNILELGRAAVREDDEGVAKNLAQIQVDLKEFVDQYDEGASNDTKLTRKELYEALALPRDMVELIKAVARGDDDGARANMEQIEKGLLSVFDKP